MIATSLAYPRMTRLLNRARHLKLLTFQVMPMEDVAAMKDLLNVNTTAE